MRLFDEALSYATEKNAAKKLAATLALLGLTPGDVRWVMVVRSDGRFVPAVQAAGPMQARLVQLAQLGVGVF